MTVTWAILFYGFIFFCGALVLHLGLWKLCLPRRQTDALLTLFALVLALGLLFMKINVSLGFFREGVFSNLFDYLRLCLLYVSLALAYTISYSAVEADSPSLAITLKIAEAGKEGLQKEKIGPLLTNEALVLPRLGDLVRDGFAVCGEGIYRLTPKGRAFVGIFIFFRKLLNAPKGG